MEEKIRQELYKKMEKEYNDFIEKMKSCMSEEILNHSYEKVIKEELLAMFYPESTKYDIEEIKALKKTKMPLEELYQGWMHSDLGINSVLEDNALDTIDSLMEEQKRQKKNKDSR